MHPGRSRMGTGTATLTVPGATMALNTTIGCTWMDRVRRDSIRQTGSVTVSKTLWLNNFTSL